MEATGAAAEKSSDSNSYRYWVREATRDAAPLTVPKKIDPADVRNQSGLPHLGSAWNRAGTWEEKNLNKWASDRIKELLVTKCFLEFTGGRAQVEEVTRCIGDAFLVTVRNIKRVGYTYELTLKVKGEWLIGEEKKKVKGHIDVLEFTFGELDDLEIQVNLSEEKDIPVNQRQLINRDLKLFLQPLKEILLQFEEELKAR